ncbi:hypothetical protein M493_15125 [Geobacillus genomosp. 3]|uniref:Uncharacterized protein n=1 Tax=Geobacillus genomosp. 3 TaxID=1921421 RepID=S5Z8V1_GEOG3|nr:hypothetical protein M493_15125 [Geobacillus genomosp. 3]
MHPPLRVFVCFRKTSCQGGGRRIPIMNRTKNGDDSDVAKKNKKGIAFLFLR